MARWCPVIGGGGMNDLENLQKRRRKRRRRGSNESWPTRTKFDERKPRGGEASAWIEQMAKPLVATNRGGKVRTEGRRWVTLKKSTKLAA